MISAYALHLFIMICIYSILSMSLNLTLGQTGLLNLGHIAFYAVGAYTSALLSLRLGIPFIWGLLIGGLLASFFGWLMTFPTLKLKGDYLALGTLGFSVIMESVLKNWSGLTRGPLGLPGIPKPEILGISFSTITSYAILAFIFAIITYLLLKAVVDSPFGRLLGAIRDDEIAAKTIGKNTFKAKMWSLMISAFFAGVAGALYAHYITFIDPTGFSLTETILVFSMVLIGGSGNMIGSVLGAALLMLLPEPLRFLPLPSSIIGGMRQAIYAVLLIIVIRLKPEGLMGRNLFLKDPEPEVDD